MNLEEIYREYLELDAQIKALTKRQDVLKDIIKEHGTCSTEHYVCIVSDCDRVVGPDAKTLKSLLGEDQYMELSRVTHYQSIKIQEKKGA